MLNLPIENGLRLALFDKADVQSLYQLMQDNYEHLSPWRRWVDMLNSPSRVEYFIKQNRRDYAYFTDKMRSKKEGKASGFQMGLYLNGRIIGVVGYQGVHMINRICSLGYWIAKDWEGQGYIRKACKRVVDHTFTEYDFNRIEIQCTVDNIRSQSIPEALGFTREARLAESEYKNGVFLDHYLYRLLRRDWERQES